MNTKELVKTIKHLEINTSRKVNDVFVGNYKSSFRGQGMEVSDLRKYEEGDDVRHIDWIITARQGKPYVKKFQETRELTTVIMVDVSSSMDFTTAKQSKKVISLKVASYLLFSALKNNDKFGVIVFSDKVHAYIAPGKGRKHFLVALREIVQAFDNKRLQKANLGLALEYLNKTIKKSSLCFLLTDSLNDVVVNKYSKRQFKIVNRKHDFVYINIYDAFEKGIEYQYPRLNIINPETGKGGIVDLGNKKVIERYNKLRLEAIQKEADIMKKNNIDSTSISTTDNIYKNLLLFFRKRALRF